MLTLDKQTCTFETNATTFYVSLWLGSNFYEIILENFLFYNTTHFRGKKGKLNQILFIVQVI